MYRNWQGFLSFVGHGEDVAQNRNVFLFPCIEKTEEVFLNKKIRVYTYVTDVRL